MRYAPASELAGLPGMPTSAFRVRAAAERMGLPSRARAGRGGGLEYLVDALPAAARLAWAARNVGDASNDAAPSAPLALPADQAARRTPGAALVTGWQKGRQDAIARVLVLFQRFWATYGGALTPALRAFAEMWTDGRVEADQALRDRFPTIGFTTLRGWHLGVQEKGLAAITPPTHHRKGQYQALAGQVGDAVLAMLMDKPHLSAQAMYDALSTQFTDLPSCRAFRRALAYWREQNAQLLEAAINPDGWRNKYMSAAGSYSEGITRPNQAWQMDSTIGDVMCDDNRRHHVVGVIDVFTRRRLFLVTRTSRANAIMALIRIAIAAWGKPEAIKTDNGADYTAAILESALLGLGIEHPLCDPFAPHQKPHIERAIGALMHELFEQLDGFIGHSVADRKGIEARRGFAERIMKEEITVELRLSPEQLQARIDAYCERRLHQPREYLQGRTPAQMAAGHPTTTLPERSLDVLLAPASASGVRTVGKKGIKIYTGFYNHAHLGGMEGKEVQVRVDDGNLGRCWVFDLDGTYICEAIDHARLGINSAEVAVTRRDHQRQVLKAGKAALRQARRSFDAAAAIEAIHAARTEAAVAASPNVVPLQRTVEHSTPTVASIEAAEAPVIDQARIAEAQAAMAARRAAAPVAKLADTPQQRYARWLLLQARVARSEALTPDEKNWFEGYANAPERASMERYFETFGLTAEQVLAG